MKVLQTKANAALIPTAKVLDEDFSGRVKVESLERIFEPDGVVAVR